MTKKDYIAIAKIIKESKNKPYEAHRIAVALSDYMEKDNPKFDKKRFIEETGVEKHCTT